MDRKLLTVFIVLGLLIIMYLINTGVQRSYNANQSELFLSDQNNIQKIIISAEQDAIELIKTDTTWSISGNDTLQIKINLIKNLFSNLKKIKKEHLVTSKKDNWINYGVTQENGTHVALINEQGETEAYYVFGKSKTEYNRCYVRTDKNNEVYLLSKNILYQLRVNPTFWGEISQPLSTNNNKEEAN